MLVNHPRRCRIRFYGEIRDILGCHRAGEHKSFGAGEAASTQRVRSSHVKECRGSTVGICHSGFGESILPNGT